MIYLRNYEAIKSAKYLHEALDMNPLATNFKDVFDNLAECFHQNPNAIEKGNLKIF